MTKQTNRSIDAEPDRRKPSRRNIIITTATVIVLVVLLVPVINLLMPVKSDPALARLAALGGEHARAAQILQDNCLDCHSSAGALPWYAALPPAEKIIQADIDRGRTYFEFGRDLAPATPGAPPQEVGLAKLQYTLTRQTMPPGEYVLLHWNRTLSAIERETLLSWVRSVRSAHYAAAQAPETLAIDVLQPIPEELPVDAAKVALGKTLYHDTRLSGNNTMSCASCHALDMGGTDRRTTSEGINGATGPINAPTVLNAAFAIKQFWDGRAADLQEQAGGPVENPIEMGAAFPDVVAKLQADPELAAQFAVAYGEAGISKTTITDAIAEYEKTLITPNSAFDRYLRGATDALNAEQQQGLKLFREVGCANCHVGVALGGQSFERMGRRNDYFAERGNVKDADFGRFNVTQDPADKYRLKVPTLRNVALTYPYFHDGSRQTLEDAVSAMGHYQAYRDLSKDEVAAVVAFLRSLTGELDGQPLQ